MIKFPDPINKIADAARKLSPRSKNDRRIVSVSPVLWGEAEHPSMFPDITRIIIAFLGIFGSVFSFITAFDLGCSYIMAGFFCLMGWLSFSLIFLLMRRMRSSAAPKILLTAASAVIIGFAVFNLTDLSTGYCETANRYLAAALEQFREEPLVNRESFVTETDLDECVDMAVCFTAMLISFVACGCSVLKTNIVLMFFVTFPPAELALYFGLVPGYPAYIALLACWAAMLACEVAELSYYGGSDNDYEKQTFRKTSSQSGAAAAAAMTAAFIIALGGGALLGYERPENADKFRTEFCVYMETFSWEKFTSDLRYYLFAGKGGVIHDGQLGNTAEVKFSGDEMLRVTLPSSDSTIYLKGFTGIDYTGYRWLVADESYGTEEPKLDTEMTSNEFFGGRALPFVPGFGEMELKNLIIQNVGMSRSEKYYPVNGAGMLESNDTGRRYGTYFPDSLKWREDVMMNAAYTQLSGTLLSDEEKLREYAYSNCLDVPSTFTAAEEFFADYKGNSVSEALSYIRSNLAKQCEYNLNAGRKPFGEDFVQWFITENKQGSCTHFASAGVLLARSLGIPARYCEGYVIKPDDMSSLGKKGTEITVSLTDTRAHAWIEVYIDNYGWLSYEMTPGYGNISYNREDITEDPLSWETAQSVVETEVTTHTAEASEVMITSEAATETVQSAEEGSSVNDRADETTVVCETTAMEENETAELTMEAGSDDVTSSHTADSTDSISVTDGTGNNESGSGSDGNGVNNDENGIDGSGETCSEADVTSEMTSYIYTDENGGAYVNVTDENGETSVSYSAADNTEDNDADDNDDTGSSFNPEVLRAVLGVLAKVICVILAFAAVIGLIILRRRIIILDRTKRIAEEPDAAARHIYRRLIKAAASSAPLRSRKKLLITLRSADPEKLGDIITELNSRDISVISAAALRARFGGGISSADAKDAAECLNSILAYLGEKRCSKMNKAIRFVYKASAKWITCTDKYI
ncbi:MAG: transglutaminase domain-containing protein [Huintestinicola sp.]